MPHSDRHEAPLTNADISLIIEALDSHEYWQLGDPTWRHSGAVILPSDDESLWADRPAPTGDDGALVCSFRTSTSTSPNT